MLKGRRLLVSIVIAWAMTVASMAYRGQMMLLLIGPFLVALWVFPLWLLPRTSAGTRYAAPFLLLAVPLALVGSSTPMADGLGVALLQRERAAFQSRDGGPASAYVLEQRARSADSIVVAGEGLKVALGGGALAALFEILGLYCWTRRAPAHRWSIALLLFVYGPAVAGAMFLMHG